MDLPAESLLAVLGVEPVLEPGRRIRFTVEMRERADRLVRIEDGVTVEGKVRDEVRSFLTRSEPGEAEHGEWRYKRALELLTELDPEQRIAELAGAVDDEGDEAAGVIVVAARAIRYLQDILPRRTRVTFTGPESVKPNDLVRFRFRRAYEVADDPMRLFGDLNAGRLARDQVRTLEALYPALHEAAQRALFQELANLKARRPRLELARWRVRMIENLLLTRSWTPELARAMQAAFKEEEPKAPPRGHGLTDKTSDASQTPVQRIASK